MVYTGSAVIRAAPRSDFVETAYVKGVTARALGYVQAGCPVHFRGPSGVGKTTLALHVAHQLGRPVMLMVGDDEFGSSDLVGRQAGYRRRRVVDHFVQSVLKTEDDVAPHWVDNRLTVACREGLTLVYDEFTRSRPEANNALLSVLEEGVLVLPARNRDGNDYVPVHPNFVALFTSNPVEYAGVHQAQDALFERFVTIDLESFDEATETAIVRARSGLTEAQALTVVRLVRASLAGAGRRRSSYGAQRDRDRTGTGTARCGRAGWRSGLRAGVPGRAFQRDRSARLERADTASGPAASPGADPPACARHRQPPPSSRVLPSPRVLASSRALPSRASSPPAASPAGQSSQART